MIGLYHCSGPVKCRCGGVYTFYNQVMRKKNHMLLNYFATADVLISKTSKKCDNDWFIPPQRPCEVPLRWCLYMKGAAETAPLWAVRDSNPYVKDTSFQDRRVYQFHQLRYKGTKQFFDFKIWIKNRKKQKGRTEESGFGTFPDVI